MQPDTQVADWTEGSLAAGRCMGEAGGGQRSAPQRL